MSLSTLGFLIKIKLIIYCFKRLLLFNKYKHIQLEKHDKKKKDKIEYAASADDVRGSFASLNEPVKKNLQTKTVYFIRHSESIWNSVFNKKITIKNFFKIFLMFFYEIFFIFSKKSSLIDSPLSKTGIQESVELSKFLKDSIDDKDKTDLCGGNEFMQLEYIDKATKEMDAFYTKLCNGDFDAVTVEEKGYVSICDDFYYRTTEEEKDYVVICDGGEELTELEEHFKDICDGYFDGLLYKGAKFVPRKIAGDDDYVSSEEEEDEESSDDEDDIFDESKSSTSGSAARLPQAFGSQGNVAWRGVGPRGPRMPIRPGMVVTPWGARAPNMAPIPGSMPNIARMPGSMPNVAMMPGSMPNIAMMPGSMPNIARMPGSMTNLARMPGSMPNVAMMPGSMPNIAMMPGSMPNVAMMPGSMPNVAMMPGSMPNVAMMPGSMPNVAMMPGSMQNIAMMPGSMPNVAMMPRPRMGMPGAMTPFMNQPQMAGSYMNLAPNMRPFMQRGPIPGSMPNLAPMPGSMQNIAQMPGSMPNMARMPGSMQNIARMPVGPGGVRPNMKSPLAETSKKEKQKEEKKMQEKSQKENKKDKKHKTTADELKTVEFKEDAIFGDEDDDIDVKEFELDDDDNEEEEESDYGEEPKEPEIPVLLEKGNLVQGKEKKPVPSNTKPIPEKANSTLSKGATAAAPQASPSSGATPKVPTPKADTTIKATPPEVGEAKVGASKVEDPKATPSKAASPKAGAAKAGAAKVGAAKDVEAKVEHPKAAASKATASKAAASKTAASKATASKAASPKAGAAKAGAAKAGAAKVGAAKVGAAKAEEPKVEEPKAEEANAEEPKAEESNVEEPGVNEIPQNDNAETSSPTLGRSRSRPSMDSTNEITTSGEETPSTSSTVDTKPGSKNTPAPDSSKKKTSNLRRMAIENNLRRNTSTASIQSSADFDSLLSIESVSSDLHDKCDVDDSKGSMDDGLDEFDSADSLAIQELDKQYKSENLLNMSIKEHIDVLNNTKYKSVVLCSDLRRAITSCFIALQDRFKTSSENVYVLKSLQELSRNADSITLFNFYHKYVTPTTKNYVSDDVDALIKKKVKMAQKTHKGRFQDTLSYIFGDPNNIFIIFGHSLWFLSFFQSFLRPPHKARNHKMRNSSVVVFNLSKYEDEDGEEQYEIDHESVKVVFKGFEKNVYCKD